MVFLEIVHPDQDRLVLSLHDGNYLFPPREMLHRLPRCRLRMEVAGETVRMEPADSSTSMRRGSENVSHAELQPGDTISVAAMQLTLRKHPESTRPPEVGQPIRPRRETLSVVGSDRWSLLALYVAGRLGRKDLRHVVMVLRNHRISGTHRGISYILRKPRFLGPEYDHALSEVEKDLHLRCDRCRRRFEPEYAVLETFRCLECDRRLSCVRRSSTSYRVKSRGSMSPPTRYDRLMAGTVLGEYKITELLGVGGYGAVYKAIDTRIQRTVALKVFPAGREGSADVLKEARNVAGFPPHPNLVLVYHVGEAEGFDYISYEYVAGDSLAYHIERHSKISLENGLRLMRDILSALATAHHLGVIHRDVKPDNILLVRVEGHFRARLTDFGLGQRLRAGQGAYFSKTIRGAPQYLAPEQFQFQISSVASDLYGVGATFFHVLTGHPPFEGDTDMELANRHVDDPVPSLQDKLPHVTRALDQLFRKLLAKDPKMRPGSAEEALEVLNRAAGELQRHNAWVSRRVWTVGTVVLTLAITAGLWFVLGQGQRRLREWVSGPLGMAPAGTQAMTRSEAGAGGPESGAPARPADETAAAKPEVGPPTPPVSMQDVPATPPASIPEAPRKAAEPTAAPVHPVPEKPTPESGKVAEESAPRPVEGAAAISDPVPAAAASPQPVAGEIERPEGAASSTSSPPGALAEEPALSSAPPPSPEAKVEAAREPVLPPSLPDTADMPLLGRWILPIAAWAEAQPGGSALERRLLVHLGELFRDALLVGRDPGDAVRYVQRYPTVAMEGPLRSGSLVASSLPIYSAEQVEAWLKTQREQVIALGVGDLLRLRLPYATELSGTLSRDVDDPRKRLEWVLAAPREGAPSAEILLLYDHVAGRLRSDTRAPGRRRLSMARLQIEVLDPAAFLARLQQAVDRLTELP